MTGLHQFLALLPFGLLGAALFFALIGFYGIAPFTLGQTEQTKLERIAERVGFYMMVSCIAAALILVAVIVLNKIYPFIPA
jgi:hypothetical protein